MCSCVVCNYHGEGACDIPRGAAIQVAKIWKGSGSEAEWAWFRGYTFLEWELVFNEIVARVADVEESQFLYSRVKLDEPVPAAIEVQHASAGRTSEGRTFL